MGEEGGQPVNPAASKRQTALGGRPRPGAAGARQPGLTEAGHRPLVVLGQLAQQLGYKLADPAAGGRGGRGLAGLLLQVQEGEGGPDDPLPAPDRLGTPGGQPLIINVLLLYIITTVSNCLYKNVLQISKVGQLDPRGPVVQGGRGGAHRGGHRAGHTATGDRDIGGTCLVTKH